MTNKQIEEVNGLLETNGEALSAFYDEGMAAGATFAVLAIITGISGVVCVTYAAKEIIKSCREKKNKKNNES